MEKLPVVLLVPMNRIDAIENYDTEWTMLDMKFSENPMRTLANARTSKYLPFTFESIDLNYAEEKKGFFILIWIRHTIFTTVVCFLHEFKVLG